MHKRLIMHEFSNGVSIYEIKLHNLIRSSKKGELGFLKLHIEITNEASNWGKDNWNDYEYLPSEMSVLAKGDVYLIPLLKRKTATNKICTTLNLFIFP